MTSILSLISTPNAGVDPFLDSYDKSRYSTFVVSTDPCSNFKHLHNAANGLVQLFSENILEIPGSMDQHKLPPKTALDIKVLSLSSMA